MCSKEGKSPTDKEELGVTVIPTEADVLAEDSVPVLKEKKKKKHRGEKRKRSCSTDSTSSNSSHKRHKKKKKKKSKDGPPSPKVNPIFLWVKQDHTKIVEVLCEDYDKRNRIKLTKTPGGWVAIPRTNMFCPETSPKEEIKDEESTVEEAPMEIKSPKADVIEDVPPEEEDPEPVVEKAIEVRKEPECTETKCCPVVNLDENHNNEVETPEECVELCKNLEDDVEEVKVPEDTPDDEPIEIPDEVEEHCTAIHQENCVNLMNELADMCFVENLKEEVVEVKDLEDIYTFVPSPSREKEEAKSYTPVKEVKKPPTPEPAPINLVVHEERKETDLDDMKLEPLKQSDLESLDILWRLPEGTTISHSKPLTDTKPVTPPLKPAPTFTQPVQEEPLNLGKPKPKEEKKLPKTQEESKLLELLKGDDRIQSNPLDQLKEVLSDPDLSVPDPLLVPRARLSALIANPAKEIPKLLAQKREVKYPKLDPDLMVVSLAHLQSILQKSGKEEELKLYQQQMMNSFEKMDPATAALNQMLWLPYLSQLEAKHNQELMAMLYPHYVYPQPYATTPPPPARYPYSRSSWPRAETSKPKAASKQHDPSKYLEQKFHEAKFHEHKHHEVKHPDLKRHDLKRHDVKHLDHKQHELKHPELKPHELKHPELKHLEFKHHELKHHELKLHDLKPHELKLHELKPHELRHLEHKHHELKHHEPKHQELKFHDSKLQEAPPQPKPEPKPKLKVRDNLVEPNQRTNLLKFDPTAPFLPAVGVPPNSNLWHPLFSSPDGKYTSRWNWTTPVTVSGE